MKLKQNIRLDILDMVQTVKHKLDKKENIQIHAENNELQNSDKFKWCTTINNKKTKMVKRIQHGGTTSNLLQDRKRQY